MKQFLHIFLLLGAGSQALAQYNDYNNYYLSAAYGVGRMASEERDIVTGKVSRTIDVSSRTWAFYPMLSHFFGNKEKKFNLGYYGTVGIGGVTSTYKTTDANSGSEVGTGSEFVVYADLRVGIQARYKLPKQQAFVGFRYFLNWQGEGLRSNISNADETACVGVFGAYRHLGVDFSYGSPGLPGVLTKTSWNIMKVEVRYRLLKLGKKEDREGAERSKYHFHQCQQATTEIPQCGTGSRFSCR